MNYQANTINRMLANPRSAESRLYLDRRHLDPAISREEAWQIMEAMSYLDEKEAKCESSPFRLA